MNTIEPAVLDMVRQEHAKAAAKAEELWQRLKTAEEAKKPYQDAYDKLLWEWSEANRLAESLAALVKAKTAEKASAA